MKPIFNFIAEGLAWILNYINGFVNSYGWSIILLTLLIKLVLLPTGIKQQRYTEKMKALQPKMKELQVKYKDNREELSRRQMEMYKIEGVNPLSGCLPLLLQLPIFFALFSLLRDPGKFGVAMKGAEFFGLVLSEFVNKQGTVAIVLVVGLSGLTTFWQQSMVMTDSSQKSFMYIMPIFFAYITLTVPAGLAIYWLANNVYSIIQQYALSAFLGIGAKGGSAANAGPGKDRKDG